MMKMRKIINDLDGSIKSMDTSMNLIIEATRPDIFGDEIADSVPEGYYETWRELDQIKYKMYEYIEKYKKELEKKLGD